MLSSSIPRTFLRLRAASATASAMTSVLSATTPPSRRTYVMWPPEFEDPVPHKSEFPSLRESGEIERKRLVPIKSAINDSTCSVFHDPMVVRLRNTFMKYSDKEKADLVLRRTFHKIKETQLKKRRRAPEERRSLIEVDPARIVNEAVENVRPLLFLNRVRVGAVLYSVPAPITTERSIFEGIRWMVKETYDRDKKAQRFHEKLADVLIDSAAYTGRVVAKKHEHHRACEQNRAYAHYRKGKY